MTLHVVTSNNVEVFRHLGAGPFQRLDVAHSVASSYDEALELVRSKRPQIAILDAELAGGDGFALCRTIKDTPELRGVHVMMVLSPVITRAQLDRFRTYYNTVRPHRALGRRTPAQAFAARTKATPRRPGLVVPVEHLESDFGLLPRFPGAPGPREQEGQPGMGEVLVRPQADG